MVVLLLVVQIWKEGRKGLLVPYGTRVVWKGLVVVSKVT